MLRFEHKGQFPFDLAWIGRCVLRCLPCPHRCSPLQLGATHVLRDNSKLSEFLDALGSEMPRLALDCLGGEAGKRLAISMRPGGTLVMHQLQSGQVPPISPSLLMYQQISLYGFNLSQWVNENGREERAGPRLPPPWPRLHKCSTLSSRAAKTRIRVPVSRDLPSRSLSALLQAYLQMLRTLAELVQADRLNIFTKTLPIAELNASTLAQVCGSDVRK